MTEYVRERNGDAASSEDNETAATDGDDTTARAPKTHHDSGTDTQETHHDSGTDTQETHHDSGTDTQETHHDSGTDTQETQRGNGTTTEPIQECPECGGRVVREDGTAESVCAECGLVVDADHVDTGPEWRAFDHDERDRKSRVGAPLTNRKHDRGLSTRIGWKDEDAYGSSLDGRKRRRISRLRTWNERFRSRDSSDRNLKHALGEIERMAAALGLPETPRETASVLYRRALEEELLPGRSIEAMATASLYAAARSGGIPRSIDEVTAVSRVDRLEIERAYRYLVRELDLQIPPSDPTDFIGRFASELACRTETERLARELVEDAVDAGIHSGRHPVGIAAAAIYAAARLSNEDLTQDEVSAVANVSNVTIRNRYVEILDVAESAATPS